MTLPTRPLPMAASTGPTPATMPAPPTPPNPPTTRPRTRSLRSFLRPYRSTLSLASGLTLVETLLDLARPWPLKVAVDNAIGGRPLEGPLAFLDGLGPAGLAAVAALGGMRWSGWGRSSGT